MYNLTLSERQAQVLDQALEIFARLGIGQFRDALEVLPLDVDRGGWYETLEEIGELLSCHTKGNVSGRGSSWSIHAAAVGESAKIAFDLHQVIRHRLAWDRAIEEGIAESEHSPRKEKLILVSFDKPLRISEEPLAIIKKGEL